jgi:hypothetical protein
MTKKAAPARARRSTKLSLHPLSLEEALGGAMATGKPPEPQNKRAKRTAMKRKAKSK